MFPVKIVEMYTHVSRMVDTGRATADNEFESHIWITSKVSTSLRSSSVVVARDSYPLGQWFNPTLRNKKLITSWGML